MKHEWKKYEGTQDVDIFANDDESGYHNGPKCEKCGYNFCHHCTPDGYETDCPL